MKKLEGKVAVVTGGNSGIGLATAKLLRQEGAKIAISGRDQETLASAKKEIGCETLAIRSDVSNPADVDAFFSKVAQAFGKIDVLFANAGVAKFAPISDSPEMLFDEVFDINVKGVFLTIPESAASPERRRIDRPQYNFSQRSRHSRNQRLLSQQGCRSLAC